MVVSVGLGFPTCQHEQRAGGCAFDLLLVCPFLSGRAMEVADYPYRLQITPWQPLAMRYGLFGGM